MATLVWQKLLIIAVPRAVSSHSLCGLTHTYHPVQVGLFRVEFLLFDDSQSLLYSELPHSTYFYVSRKSSKRMTQFGEYNMPTVSRLQVGGIGMLRRCPLLLP